MFALIVGLILLSGAITLLMFASVFVGVPAWNILAPFWFIWIGYLYTRGQFGDMLDSLEFAISDILWMFRVKGWTW